MKRLLFILLSVLIFVSCERIEQDKLNAAQSHVNTYPDSALIYLEEIDPSVLTNKLYMEYLLTMTQARYNTNQDISTDTLLFAYKDQIRKFPDQKAAWFYFYIGKVYYLQGNFGKALTEFMKCEELLIEDIYFTAMLQIAYADIYLRKLELQEAILYYQKAAENFKSIEKWQSTSICYNQLGNCFLYQDSIDKAFIYYDKCLEYKHYWKPTQKAQMLITIAQAYHIKGDNISATDLLHEALQIPVNNDEKILMYIQLANIYMDHPNKFISYITQALELSQEYNPNELIQSNIHLHLSDFYANIGDNKLALEHHRQYSYYLGESIKKDFSTTLKEVRQENHIRHLQTQNLHLTIKRQRILLLLVVVCTLCITVGFIIVRRYKHKKQELIDARQKIEILKEMATGQEQEKGSLRSIVLQYFEVLKKVAVLDYTFSHKKEVKNLLKTFNQIVYQNDHITWEGIYNRINSVHGNLFNNIKEEFSELKDSEFKICCLTIAQFNSIEIGVILNYTPKSIQVKKSQIRKKLGIEPMGDITDFFNEYFKLKQKA